MTVRRPVVLVAGELAQLPPGDSVDVGGVVATKVPISLTAGQTTVPVPGGYTTAGVIVFLNGAFLTATEYTATDLTNVVLATGAPSTGSILDVIVFTGAAVYVLPDNLASLAALVGAADKGVYFTGVNTLAMYDLTSQARSLLAASTAADQRTVLGAGNHLSQLLTAQATTSGTFKDFTGIASWAKKISIPITDFSTSGSANYLFQLGTSSGIENTGYDTTAVSTVAAATVASAAQPGSGLQFTTGGVISSAAVGSGLIVLTLVGGTTWQMSASYSVKGSGASSNFANTTKTLAGALDRIRLTTVGGTDTLDGGSFTALVEGYA